MHEAVAPSYAHLALLSGLGVALTVGLGLTGRLTGRRTTSVAQARHRVRHLRSRLQRRLAALPLPGAAGTPSERAAEVEFAFLALAAELRAGRTLPQALASVLAELPPQIAPLFRQWHEAAVRGDVRAGLDAWLERHPDDAIVDLAAIVALSHDLGGGLASTLERLAAQSRRQRLLQAFIAAKTADARVSAVVLAAAPCVLTSYLWLFRRELLAPLWTDPIGSVAAVYALLSWLAGILVIRRLLARIHQAAEQA